MKLKQTTLAVLLGAFCALPTFTHAVAQDDAAKAAADTTKAPAAESKDPVKEWAELNTRRKEIAVRMKEIRTLFGKTTDAGEKTKLRDEFNELNDEFGSKLMPRFQALQKTILEKDPDDLFANEMAMHNAFETNQYADAMKFADKVIAGGDPNGMTLGIAGVSRFALHKFPEALEMLKKAGTQDPMANRYLSAAEDYIEFWDKEQKIRKAEAPAGDAKALPRIEFETSRGKIECVLYEDEAPNTVANFIELIEKKTYDGTKFHRVLSNFMIQGGDPLSKDDDPTDDGTGGPGHMIKCECYSDDARIHFAGTLSMAHAGRDTGGSQFFVTHLPTAHLNGKHTVFGRVVKGMDVVTKITKGDELKSAKVLSKRNHEYKSEKLK